MSSLLPNPNLLKNAISRSLQCTNIAGGDCENDMTINDCAQKSTAAMNIQNNQEKKELSLDISTTEMNDTLLPEMSANETSNIR